jgi:hypothetical protein
MRRFVAMAGVLLVGVWAQAQARAQALTDERVETWAAHIRPDEPESCWREVHWRESFRAGVRDSQIEGKPILLWAMNGHPMGCV